MIRFAKPTALVLCAAIGLCGASAALAKKPTKAAATEKSKAADKSAGKPLLVMRQIAFDELDRPLFTSTIRYVGDRYRLKTFFARSGSPARTTDESRIIRPRG